MSEPMPPEEILRDAEDMVKHYPDDRLRLTGAEVMALVEHVHASGRRAGLEEMRAALALARRALWNEWHDKPRIGAEDAVAAIDRALAVEPEVKT